MPLCQMSLVRKPKIVAVHLENIQRDFLQGGGTLEKKIHLIKRGVVCSDKGNGGLGIRIYQN